MKKSKKEIELQIKTSRVVAEPIKCIVCGGWFPRSSKKNQARLGRGVKRRGILTCSPKCSREYSK